MFHDLVRLLGLRRTKSRTDQDEKVNETTRFHGNPKHIVLEMQHLCVCNNEEIPAWGWGASGSGLDPPNIFPPNLSLELL